ncbi:MAG: transcription elongation factor GreA [Bacteroidota bacterium]
MAFNGKSETVYLTRERLVEMEQELHSLKTEGRRTVAQKIAEARGHGDLSENAEYEAAKEEQQHLEMKIMKLEQTLSRAKIIDARDLPRDNRIYILSRVEVKDLGSGVHCEYLLVSPEEASFEQNKISVTSPIGKALLGKVQGDKVDIRVPAGLLHYEILKVSR